MSNGHKQGRTIQRFADGQLVGTLETVIRKGPRCDYCNTRGCHWTAHEQAHADVAHWQREQAHEDY